MRRLPIILAAAGGLAAAVARADDILEVGDHAPSLAVSGWVKGEKIDRFEPGKTYVVEFWATWCAPCKASIPKLTELAHKYKEKGVRFIGVNVRQDDVSKVRPFVDDMGDKMDYCVALDDVPAKGDPWDGAMAKTWMLAAEERAIPAAFIVHDGKIAWIGLPMELDRPLEQIVNGSWDLGAAVETRHAIVKKKLIRRKILTSYRAGDHTAALAAIEAAAAQDPSMGDEFESKRFNCLCWTGRIDQAVNLGSQLLKKHQDDAITLNNAFFEVIDLNLKQEPDPRIAKLALDVLWHAHEMTKGENNDIEDSLAVALYRTGNLAAAVAAEEKAIKLLEANVKDRSGPTLKTYLKQLETFRRAVQTHADKNK
jgi:thiol-disulfide isomerase/thioredoxin